MDEQATPVEPEMLVGKDELDEDDEMDLSGADLVVEPGEAGSLGPDLLGGTEDPLCVTFPFRFTPEYRAAAALFGVTPVRAGVTVGAGRLEARYGPWCVVTDLANVAGTDETGPYGRLKTIGPAHLSFADRGLTFASNPERGLCIRFHEPVPGIEPTGRLRHPALTVTVSDVPGLARAISEARRQG
ncbi:MAG TPA: hypothetical protein VFS16_10490 [Acidimicrobiia bacterium]|nr:hypothetical protein [Acidimicrobiia bacterium]